MSSVPQAQPTVDPNVQSAQEIADRMAAQVAPANNPEPTQEPGLARDFSVVLETGQTYKANTKDELIAQLVKAQENASKRIKELGERPAPVPTPQAPTAAPAFDQNQYWQLMSTDPLGAQRYALQFTPEAENLRTKVEEYGQVIENIRNQAVANQFKAETPDMPIDDDSLGKFDKVWQESNLPLSVRNLQLVHAFCVKQGIYTPVQQTPAQATPQALPTPSLNSPGYSTVPTAQVSQQKVNEMSAEDLGRYIAQLQQ